MTKLLLFLSYCVSAFASHTVAPTIFDIDVEKELADHFAKFVQFYNKKYEIVEEQQRFETFKANVIAIKELNDNNDGVTYDINEFADLSHEEFTTKVLTKFKSGDPFDDIFTLPVLSVEDILGKKPILNEDGQMRIVEELPKSVDWRKTKCMAPVKDQSFCGSCWAFSTINALENFACAEAMAKGVDDGLVEFSEQQLVDCDREYNDGCNGGLYHVAYQYIEKHGICQAKDYSYTGSSFSHCKSEKCQAAHKVTSIKRVSRTVEDVKAAVAKSALAIAIDGSRIQFYKSGVFKGCHETTQFQLNHAVNLVGYGVDENSKTPYWLIRNSWGSKWGDAGYIKMEMADIQGESIGMCGVLWGPVAVESTPVKKTNLRESVQIA